MVGGSLASLAVGIFPGNARVLTCMIFGIAVAAVTAFAVLARRTAEQSPESRNKGQECPLDLQPPPRHS
jgi:hypothetical protein